MAIETICHTCGNRLRVADEHAGKLARCPACQTVYTVPAAAFPHAVAASNAPANPSSAVAATIAPVPQAGNPFASHDVQSAKWHLKTPDGLTYGPITRAELDQWQREGRITAQSQVLNEAEGRWIWAGQLYPQLQSLASDAPKPVYSQSSNPFAPSAHPFGQAHVGTWLEPHHGALVLTLGIVGIIFCGVLAWVAVILGMIDLHKMAKGRMDPGGRGLTIAGLICGAISVAIQLFVLLSGVVELLS